MNENEASQSERVPTFCLLGASYNTGNRGVAALASGTINSVRHSFPGAKIFLLDYDRHPGTHSVRCSGGTTEVELVNLRFSWKIWLRNNIARLLLTALMLRLVPSGLRARLIARNQYLKRVHVADRVGSIAGGDSFSDIYGLGRLLYVSLPQLLVLQLGRPLVLLPQTLGPFKSSLAKWIARYIMRRAEVVYARDRESLTEIQPMVGGDSPRFRFAYDMAFALESFPPTGERLRHLETLDGCRPLVGLNVSGLLYMGGYTRDNMFGLKSDYRQLLRDIIQFFVKQEAHVLLIPHVVGAAANSESDAVASAQIHRELRKECEGRLHLLEGEYDQHESKYVIGRCDFLLGSRMHACIAALSQCVPAVGLAYSKKFKGVLRSIQQEELVADLREYNLEETLGRIAAAYESRGCIREQLEKRMPEVRQSVLDLFSQFASDASETPRFEPERNGLVQQVSLRK